MLAFVNGEMVVNTFSPDKESPPPSHENRDSSIDLDEDDSHDANNWIALGFSSNFNKLSIPSKKEAAEKVSVQNGITLDQIQCIAYEISYSSFLLNLLNDWWNKNSDIVPCLQWIMMNTMMKQQTTQKGTCGKAQANWCRRTIADVCNRSS